MAGRQFLHRLHSSRKATCAFAALIHFSSASYSTSFSQVQGWSSLSYSTKGIIAATVPIRPDFSSDQQTAGASRHILRSDTARSMSSSGDASCSGFSIAQIPCLSDNYGYLIHDEETGHTAAVDTPEFAAYDNELKKRGWKLTHILNTHHHYDHTGANLELKNEGVTVYGPVVEKDRIPGIDVPVGGGDKVPFGNSHADVINVGGHTVGHIAYHFGDKEVVFTGDALFALGCGRMFEGTPTQFWESLKSLRALPDETTVYCAHEYTESNAKFAKSVEPGNADLQARVDEVYKKRSRGEPTVPSKLGDEKKTNPFLRVDVSEEIRKNVGAVAGDSDSDVFAKVRRAKDTFRG